MEEHQTQEIREAYFKAVEGLMTLAETLEAEVANQEPPRGPLLTEYLHPIEALDAMKHNRLEDLL